MVTMVTISVDRQHYR